MRRLWQSGGVFGTRLGSGVIVGVGLLLASAIGLSPGAWADSVADIDHPSSAIPGCVNIWDPGNARSNSQTCEAQAVQRIWTERAAAIATARDVVVRASRDPGHADVNAVVTVLGDLAAAADALTASYHSGPQEPNSLGATLSWMRARFEAFHLPVPNRLGDGFRIMAHRLSAPHILTVDRNLAYDRSAALADALSEAVAESLDQAVRDTDAAVRAAHQAALEAARAAVAGQFDAAAARAAIAKAAGPDHADVAANPTALLLTSVASRPNQSHYLQRTGRSLAAIPHGLVGLLGVCLALALLTFPRRMAISGLGGAILGSGLFIVAAAVSWLPIVFLVAIGVLPDGVWPGLVWLLLFLVLFFRGGRFVPARLRQGWFSIFGLFGARQAPVTHGSAHLGEVAEATAGRHLAPEAPADAFVLGWLHGTGTLPDGRFRQDGHILTCAPTGAGKGIGAVIPNLLDYPGSAFVLDIKGETYAVTARARRAAGQDVFLIDPFGITGAASHGMNWLDVLQPEDPDVVALAGAMAEMLVVSGNEQDPHWTETARELLRGLLIYVAGEPSERRSMSALRAMVTASEDGWAEVLADMLADPLRGHRIVARTASAFLNRPVLCEYRGNASHVISLPGPWSLTLLGAVDNQWRMTVIPRCSGMDATIPLRVLSRAISTTWMKTRPGQQRQTKYARSRLQPELGTCQRQGRPRAPPLCVT